MNDRVLLRAAIYAWSVPVVILVAVLLANVLVSLLT